MSKTIFKKDEENARLTIQRVFPASQSRVWQALTDPAILDQWFGPAPWKVETLHMDFRVGGYWHYAMNGPQGEQHFGRQAYLDIEPEDRFVASDVFCDAGGNADESLPRQEIQYRLTRERDGTKVVAVVQYASLEDMNKVLAMGMQEGLTMAQNQLEALLARESAA